MAVQTSNLEGQDHIVGEGAFTRCGIELPFGTPYVTDVEPESPCPTCFPDSKPKRRAKADDDKPVNSTKKSVGDKA